MYCNLYHVSDLRKIVRFLREIECIEFECNAFVLVLVQIDLIYFEHTKCISSTSIKTNTNLLCQKCKIYNHTVTIVSQKYRELCLIS